jgi:hypothetical protein
VSGVVVCVRSCKCSHVPGRFHGCDCDGGPRVLPVCKCHRRDECSCRNTLVDDVFANAQEARQVRRNVSESSRGGYIRSRVGARVEECLLCSVVELHKGDRAQASRVRDDLSCGPSRRCQVGLCVQSTL